MNGKGESGQHRLNALSSDKAKLVEMLLQQKRRNEQIIKAYPRTANADCMQSPTSPAQQRMWMVDQLEGSGAAYHVPIAARLQGILNRMALERALDSLLRRHEVLRTVFANVGGEPVQRILPPHAFALQFVDLSMYEETDRLDQARLQQSQEVEAPFDLSAGPLIRGRLLRLADDDHVLLITVHHIVFDGWSLGIFNRELAELYGAYRNDCPNPLPPLEIQYADFAQWQRQWLRAGVVDTQLEYWRTRLKNAAPQVELPTDRPRPLMPSHAGRSIDVHWDEPLSARLRKFARQQEMSLFMVVYAAWALLLARLSGQSDIVIGTPVANRQRPELNDLIGFFVNTLALRLEVDGNERIRDLLLRVKETTLEAYDNQDVPFEQVVEAVQPQRTAGRNPLFQVMLVVLNVPSSKLRLPGLSASQEYSASQRSKFDLLLTLEDRPEGIRGSIEYATDLFDPQTAQRWMGSLTLVVEGMINDVQIRVEDISLLSRGQLGQIAHLFNATEAEYSRQALVHELFEAQARRTPDADAVVFGDESMTYSQLDSYATRLAAYLCSHGIRPDEPIGICVERGPTMIIGLIAILKAGGAYLPLDPNYPVERLQHMLEDADPRIVLTQESVRDVLPRTSAFTVALDTKLPELPGASNAPFIVPGQLRPNHLVYLIYTSGSTGRPKGTAMSHGAMVNLIEWQLRAMPGKQQHVLQFAALSFDVAFQETFTTLCSGSTLVMLDEWVRKDGQALVDLLAARSVQRLFIPPLMLQSLAECINNLDSSRLRLEDVITAGEQLRITPEIRELFRNLAECRLHNHYGPTESHVVTALTLPKEVDSWPALPTIGQPIANTQMYVLDQRRRPLPIGVIGEIYIAGAGLARGYLGRPELTAERFIADSVNTTTAGGARMYQTGDLGRWRADRTIEYLGRNDSQVKIRGYRIELGEIEAQLACHEQVKEAAVVVRQDAGEKRLVAYLVKRDASSLNSRDLRAHMKMTLPDYMVPGAFIFIDQLPLTPNGKLDRRALPEPRTDDFESQYFEPPRGEVEELLASLWQDLLRLNRVSRLDNFFELGGHSLLLVQMTSRLRRAGLHADVRSLYLSPTLADLALVLTEASVEPAEVPRNLIPDGCQQITPEMLPLVHLTPWQIEVVARSVPGGAANIKDIYPLAPLQEGILFHHLMTEHGSDAYVLPTILKVSSRERLSDLIAALQMVIDRHDVLRTALLWDELPQPLQVVHRQAVLQVEQERLDHDRAPLEQMQEWSRPDRQQMDLHQAPMVRLRILPHEDGAQWYVLLQLHHIATDATSLRMVIAEVVAYMDGRGERLPESISYRDHVAQTLAYAKLNDAKELFRSKLADVTEPTTPFGLADVHGDGSQIDEFSDELDVSLARRVRVETRRLGITAATFFHAAGGLVIAHTSGRDDVVFGSVLLGRLHGSAGAKQILGMFINTLPLRLRMQGLNAAELMRQTQQELVALLAHEQSSLAEAQRCSGIGGGTPLFSALLNFRHSVPDPDAEWVSARGIEVVRTQNRTNYPLTISIDDLGSGFRLTVQTDRRISPRRVAAYMHTAVRSLVDSLERSSKASVLTLPILPRSELQLMTRRFNETQVAYPRHTLVHQLFEEQVSRSPAAVALVHAQEQLTYGELNAKANQLARYLRTLGVGPGQLVALCVSRSTAMVIGLLGILKAGAAYLPMDPNYPADRLQYMLKDAAPCIVLTEHTLNSSLPSSRSEVIALDGLSSETARCKEENVPSSDAAVSPQALVYVIYTSGSTGLPKGTAMSHGAMTNLVEWHRDIFPDSRPQRVLQFAALSFDVAFQEIFSTLCSGNTLVLIDEWIRRDAPALAQLLSVERIQRLFLPPLMLQSLAEHFREQDVVPACLREVITAGEQLRISPEIVELFERLGHCRLHNHYGPTESHVVTALTLEGSPKDWPVLPSIGRPIANTAIYVLDARRWPVPVGVSGEIYIGGAGLARGYLGHPELTAQRFSPDHFSADASQRLYRTGDVGQWLEDGTIEYLGRNDGQVKIRGYRVELGEIEAHLARHPLVKEAAVIAHEDVTGNKRLVGYVTTRAGAVLTIEQLRVHLKLSLPEHMIPSALVILDKLPTTPSGKVDRRALPTPDADAYPVQRFEAPEGAIELGIAEIWQELLNVERVGRLDNFFELGGHSLLAIKALVRINQAHGSTLRATDIYKTPILKDLAGLVMGRFKSDELVDLRREAQVPRSIVSHAGTLRIPARNIMLTGATGFVGRFLLVQLLLETSANIYCLIRSRSQPDAMSRIRGTMVEWDLWRDEFESRIVAIPGDLRKPKLGLDEVTYRGVSEEIDCIYHCGTSMNHLESYSMAKPANVSAALELLKLATSRRRKAIHYISTLGVFASSAADMSRTIDEKTPIDHEKHTTANGYVTSKWVAEKIFMTANERGIPCNIFRLGLVWGDSKQGRYDELQHCYRVLKSCLLSGYGIEDYRYEATPLPVDFVAQAIVALAKTYPEGRRVFHIASTSVMREGMLERVGESLGISLKLISYYEWICELKRLHHEGRSLPAVPVVEYAFSLSEDAFEERQRAVRATRPRIDCSRTLQVLGRVGARLSPLEEDLLLLNVKSMLLRDAELRQLMGDNAAAEFMQGERRSRFSKARSAV